MNQVIRWSTNDILINNTVRIVEPYRAENVSIDPPAQSANVPSSKASAKGDTDTKTHIIKLVNVKNRIKKESIEYSRWKNSGWINLKQRRVANRIQQHEPNRVV